MSSYKRVRKVFGKKIEYELPNLIGIQKSSYENFLQINVDSASRVDKGLQEVFKSIFPIEDPAGTATIEFVKYEFGDFNNKGGNYSAPLRVTLRLIVWEIDEDSGSKEIKGIKEQEVFFGDVPLMTKTGTFVINGTERVIVSQMHRSPGVFFDHDRGRNHSSGKFLYSARIIPYRGSWLDFEFDGRDLIYFRIDRKRKMYATTLLRACGMDNKEMLDTFYKQWKYSRVASGWSTNLVPETLRGARLSYDLINADSGEVIVESGIKITPRIVKKLIEQGVKSYIVPSEELVGKYLADNLVDESTGQVYLPLGKELAKEDIVLLAKLEVNEFSVLAIDGLTVGPYIYNTMMADKNSTREECLSDIYRVIRPGEPSTPEAADLLFKSLFFDKARYDLSSVGRVKLNAKLNLSFSEEDTILHKEDIIDIVKILASLRDGVGEIDDIDHLGNRRVRSVGELMENQFRVGLLRVEKGIFERLSSVDIDTVMPYDLVNSKLLVAAIREFFTASQLSQFMDQTNPLSEITHKRRVSALGPGGLTRDRAGFEVRDVHPTHYGRICPIETPEGQNIGLINSLATYARINKYGFIEAPYRKIVDHAVTDEVVYLSAIEEGKYTIAQANAVLDENKKFVDELVSARRAGEFLMAPSNEINFIDVSPMQLVSVAASLIPFLENDDANRALMGSNMQRQAVPLLCSEAPFVGTGVEAIVARDSGSAVICTQDGIVEHVDSTRIVVRTIDNEQNKGGLGVDIYHLEKYKRSNHNTCINQKPLVNVGDVVKINDVIADGPSTDMGELALGRNVLVSFLSWNGCNFEDSIVISERIVKDDVFTSIHIEAFEVVARDTRLGPEEITRDIPNVSDEALRSIDESGIIHVGAEVNPGDILVGKVTPKSESPMTPEEKLLRAIFGEKAADVRDSSLHVPPGVSGTVVDVQVLTRRGVEKDQRSLTIERQKIESLAKDKDDELSIIEDVLFDKVNALFLGQTVVSGPRGLKAGMKLTEDMLTDVGKSQIWQVVIEDVELMNEFMAYKEEFKNRKAVLDKRFNLEVDRLKMGDDLPQGALKVVKVFVATKHKLQPGDKMAGRHGNKGVISRIVPAEDMPYLEDGTVIDIILNPLGIPSRMNVGQVLETHLGWACHNLGKQVGELLKEYQAQRGKLDDLKAKMLSIYSDKDTFAQIQKMSEEELVEFAKKTENGVSISSPVFDGAKESDVNRMLTLAGLDTSGQVRLIDGRTGEYFDRKVTVGYKYMLKLHHLVDDKIHARSIGPYSLVTQQPLGGKSHFGGQRLGEMECWALQAYGAAYTLQEMLTVKSDDVAGRIKVYESIIRGDNNFESGIPESFHVMIKELRSLCLNIDFEQQK